MRLFHSPLDFLSRIEYVKCVRQPKRETSHPGFVRTERETSLSARAGGNGEFIKITDRTNEYFNETSAEKLRNDLLRTGWGEGETRLIVALLEEHIEKKRG